MKVTTGRKTRLNLISNTLTRSRKVVSLTKLLTSRQLVMQASASLYSCATWAKPSFQGRNVLYITMEMQKRKFERIDANLLNVNIQEITDLPKQMFETKVNNLAKKTQGTLIIKEYPTWPLLMSDISNHFLMNLHLRSHLDLILFSLITLTFESFLSISGEALINSYTVIKSIVMVFRGLGLKPNVPVVSFIQTTRSGFGALMLKLTDISESFGLPATDADLMFASISTEEALKNLDKFW